MIELVCESCGNLIRRSACNVDTTPHRVCDICGDDMVPHKDHSGIHPPVSLRPKVCDKYTREREALAKKRKAAAHG